MMNKYICILCIMTLLISCGRDTSKNDNQYFGYSEKFNNSSTVPEIKVNNKDVKTITIPQDINEKYIEFDSIIGVSKVVQLETNKKCPIGEVRELLFIDDKIVVVDRVLGKSKAYIFTAGGDYISKVGELGRGPREYSDVSDVSIDSKNKHIVIWDGRRKKMHFYDSNGNYIKNKSIFCHITNMALLNNGYQVMYQLKNINKHISGVEDYQIIIADSTQKIIGKSLSYNKPKYNSNLDIMSYTDFNVIGEKVFFNPVYTNDIYEFSSYNGTKLKYHLHLGDKDILNNLESYKSLQDKNNAMNNDKLWSFNGFALEAGNYFYVKIDNAGLIFYNYSTNKLVYGNSYMHRQTFEESKKLPKISNNILEVKASNGNSFISVVYPSSFFNEIEDTSIKFRDLKTPIQINDNPILVFFNLKD